MSMLSLSSLLSSLPLKQHKHNSLRRACKRLLYLFVLLREKGIKCQVRAAQYFVLLFAVFSYSQAEQMTRAEGSRKVRPVYGV